MPVLILGSLAGACAVYAWHVLWAWVTAVNEQIERVDYEVMGQ